MATSEVRLWPVSPGATIVSCAGCGARIVFGRTDKGRPAPLSIDSPLAEPSPETGDIAMAPSHFTDCPAASQFSKRGRSRR